MALRLKNDHDGRWVPGPALDPCPRCWGCVGVPVSNPTSAAHSTRPPICHASCSPCDCLDNLHQRGRPGCRLTSKLLHGVEASAASIASPARALSPGVAGSASLVVRSASIGSATDGQGQQAWPILILPCHGNSPAPLWNHTPRKEHARAGRSLT